MAKSSFGGIHLSKAGSLAWTLLRKSATCPPLPQKGMVRFGFLHTLCSLGDCRTGRRAVTKLHQFPPGSTLAWIDSHLEPFVSYTHAVDEERVHVDPFQRVSFVTETSDGIACTKLATSTIFTMEDYRSTQFSFSQANR